MSQPLLIVIAGPTAAGKTRTAIELAKRLGTHIFSADSRQFYREMSIGTAKPTKEELSAVPHYFIDNLSVEESYSVGDYERDIIPALEEYFRLRKTAIITGGSGLYIEAAVKGLDSLPEIQEGIRERIIREYEQEGLDWLRKELQAADPVYYSQVDVYNPQRMIRALEVCRSSGKPFSDFRLNRNPKRNFEVLKFGIAPEREILYRNINHRVDRMLDEGLLEEAATLLPWREHNALQTVGYKEIFDYLDGNSSLETAVSLIKQNTRRYAKRQLTWFRRDPDMKWFDPGQVSSMIDYTEKYIINRTS